MPFRSNAQRKKMFLMADRGQISRETVEEFAEATPKGKKLPEHVTPRHPKMKRTKWR